MNRVKTELNDPPKMVYRSTIILTYILNSFYIGLVESSNHNYDMKTINKIFFPSKVIMNFFKSIN